MRETCPICKGAGTVVDVEGFLVNCICSPGFLDEDVDVEMYDDALEQA